MYVYTHILLRNAPGKNTCEGVRKASKHKGSSMVIISSVIPHQGMHMRSLSSDINQSLDVAHT